MDVDAAARTARVSVGDARFTVERGTDGQGEATLVFGDGIVGVRPATGRRVVDTVTIAGRAHRVRRLPPPSRDHRPEVAPAGGAITAPMPGRIVRIHVSAGDDVAATQPLIVLEAMKMEHVIAAPSAGRVARLLVAVGDQVARGEPLAELAADGPEPTPTPERGA